MLRLTLLLKWTFTVIVLWIGGVVVLSYSDTVTAAETVPDWDYRFGLSVKSVDMGEINPLVNDGYNVQPCAQRASITTPYHMGYKLSVKASDLMMIDGDDAIQPTQGGSGGLLPNHWGILSNDQFNMEGHWPKTAQWLNPTVEREVLRYDGDFPPSRDGPVVYFGVRADAQTRAGRYQSTVTYTLLPEMPTTPVVASVKPASHAIGNDSQLLTLRGLNLDRIERLAMDFNGDNIIGDSELCRSYSADQLNYSATCTVPDKPDDPAGDGQGVYPILISTNGRASRLDQVYTYYYQVGLDSRAPQIMKVKSRARLAKAATDGAASFLLTTDGDVYQRGEAVGDWASNGANFSMVRGAGLTEFSGKADNDPIVDIAARSGGVLAVTKSGRLYHWGKNNAGHSKWYSQTSQPTIDSWWHKDGLDESVRDVVLGPDFAAVVTDGKMYIWGNNRTGQLGVNSTGMLSAGLPVDITNQHSVKFDNDEHYQTVSVGDKHAVAMTNKGRVMTWGCHGAPCNDGDNKDGAPGHEQGDGRLGFNTTNTAWRAHDATGSDSDYLYPYRHKILKALAGADFTIALTSDGQVLTMGANNFGQLGMGNLSDNQGRQANKLAIPGRVIDIDAAGQMVMALTADGQVYTWGKVNGMAQPDPAPLVVPASYGQIQTIAAGSTIYAANDDHVVMRADNDLLSQDIIGQLRYPTYGMKISGAHLDKIDTYNGVRGGIWVDYNRNNIMDAAERVLMSVPCGNQTCLQMSASQAQPTAGQYDLNAWTGYGGTAVLRDAISIVQADGNEAVPNRWGFAKNPGTFKAVAPSRRANTSELPANSGVSKTAGNHNKQVPPMPDGLSPSQAKSSSANSSPSQSSAQNNSHGVSNNSLVNDADTADIPATDLAKLQYNRYMTGQINKIKQWLGTGSINIFGIQFSGKDTLGVPLARALDGVFVSSGDLVRAAVNNEADPKLRQAAIDSQVGVLTPTEQFRRLIIPHLKNPRLTGKPLVLGSVGRWIGEEEPVMAALDEGGHPLKVVIVLHISNDEVWRRWESVKETRNGGRADDQDRSRVKLRLDEFRQKTMPVIKKYRQLGYVIDIDASGTIEQTYASVINELAKRADVSLSQSVYNTDGTK